MLQPLYRVELARLGSGRNDPEYHALPAHLRGLADAASAARAAYLALADACRQARAAGAWAAVEGLDAAELAQWNTWQAIEGRGAELLADARGSTPARVLAQIGGAA